MIGAAANERPERSAPDHSSKTLMTCDFTPFEGVLALRGQAWPNRTPQSPTPPNELEETLSRPHRATSRRTLDVRPNKHGTTV